jgi:hypothetical protein
LRASNIITQQALRFLAAFPFSHDLLDSLCAGPYSKRESMNFVRAADVAFKFRCAVANFLTETICCSFSGDHL